MLDVPGDAPLLRETLEELEIALVVLDLVLAPGVAHHVQATVNWKDVTVQEGIENLDDGLLLKDARITVQRCKPQPRA